MNDQKLAAAVELSNKIRDTKLQIQLCGKFARECFDTAKMIEKHPDYRTPHDTVNVKIEYSDGHFGNTLKLTVPNAHVILKMCVKELQEELKVLEKEYHEM